MIYYIIASYIINIIVLKLEYKNGPRPDGDEQLIVAAYLMLSPLSVIFTIFVKLMDFITKS